MLEAVNLPALFYPMHPRSLRGIPSRTHKAGNKPKAIKPRVRNLERAREYWAENKDRINAKRRAKTAAKLARKARHADPDKKAQERAQRAREYWRAYYLANREKVLARVAQWQSDNRDKRNAYFRARRAAKKAGGA